MTWVAANGKGPTVWIRRKPLEVAVPEDTIFISRNFIVNIQQLKFEKTGLYAIDIAMDGRQEGTIPLLVKQMPQQQPQGVPPAGA